MLLTPQTMQTLITVAFSCFMTEWLCSITLEWQYIWRRKLSVLTLAYVGCRYIVFVNVTLMMVLYHSGWGENYCSKAYLVTPVLSMLGLFCAEVVCIIRVWSIHKRQKYVLAILSLLLAAMIVVQIISIIHYSRRVYEEGQCKTSSESLWLAAFWIAPAILDTIMVAFSIAAVVHETRRYGYNRLLTIILRDQVAYFVLVAAACLTTATMMTSSASYVDSLNNPPAIVVSSIAATRIVISLKMEGAAASTHQHHGGYAMSENTSRGVTIKVGPNQKSWFHIRPKTTSTTMRLDGVLASSASDMRVAAASSTSSHGSVKFNSPKFGGNADLESGVAHAHEVMHDVPHQQLSTPGTPNSRRVKDIKGRAASRSGHKSQSGSLASQFDFTRDTRNGRHSPFGITISSQEHVSAPEGQVSSYDGGAELTEVLTGGGRASPPPFSSSLAAEQEMQQTRRPGRSLVEELEDEALQRDDSSSNSAGGGVVMFTNKVTTIEEEEDMLARQSCDTVKASAPRGRR